LPPKAARKRLCEEIVVPEITATAGGGPACRDRNIERCRDYRLTLKARVLAHYGTFCACCGATTGLSIDHIDGNGREHRRELFGRKDHGGQHFYLWLIRQGFPAGYQTLCLPCNTSKGRGPGCRMDHGTADRRAA
jgi:hypothetical protein